MTLSQTSNIKWAQLSQKAYQNILAQTEVEQLPKHKIQMTSKNKVALTSLAVLWISHASLKRQANFCICFYFIFYKGWDRIWPFWATAIYELETSSI